MCFGILKKRWKMIECGICFRNIRTVEQVFVVCCILHNMMLSKMDTHDSSVRVGRGAPLDRDAICLQDALPPAPVVEGAHGVREAKKLAKDWTKRRRELAEHLEYAKCPEKRLRSVYVMFYIISTKIQQCLMSILNHLLI